MAGKLNLDALLKLPNCSKCEKPIVGKMMKVAGKTFHDTCFLCAQCNKSLADGYLVDETKKPEDPELPQHKPHCADCYAKLFMPTCKGCSKTVTDASYVQACEGAWHDKCFTCGTCRQSLAGMKHYPVDGKPYCEKDYWAAKMKHQGDQSKTGQPKSQSQGKLQVKAASKSMVGKSSAAATT